MVKEIPLSKGMVAIVDDDDFDSLSRYKWFFYKTGGEYAYRVEDVEGKRKTILMHRAVMFPPNDKVVDHIDGNGLNNQKRNLRVCSHAENLRNRTKVNINNTSGYRGVSWCKHKKRWEVKIVCDGKPYKIGYFKEKLEAAQAYNKKAVELFGEYASLNKIEGDA